LEFLSATFSVMKNIVFEALAEAAHGGEAVALGIITGVKGSSPQKVGAKALFYRDGRIKGTLGGGCLEAEIQQRAIQSLRSGESSVFDLLLDHDFGWDDGLICGGKVFGVILPNAQKMGEKFWRELAERKENLSWGVTRDFEIRNRAEGDSRDAARHARQEAIALTHGETRPPNQEPRIEDLVFGPDYWLYHEIVTPPCALWIAGAGHIAQAVAPLALQLDFDVAVFDDRPALANYDFFPWEVSLKVGEWEKLCALPLPEVPSFALIVTRGHRHDALVLKDWIHKHFLFLGMIGSSRKARTIFDHFEQEKIATTEEMSRVACPVGIQIGSQSVPEIAVSIMAQFIEKRAELAGGKQVSTATKAELV
jgi:xanthine dehydrogenase accessory factor